MLKLARIDIDVHTVDGDEVLSREVRQACSQTLPCQLSVCKLGYEQISVLPEFFDQYLGSTGMQHAVYASLIPDRAV